MRTRGSTRRCFSFRISSPVSCSPVPANASPPAPGGRAAAVGGAHVPAASTPSTPASIAFSSGHSLAIPVVRGQCRCRRIVGGVFGFRSPAQKRPSA
ncbi:hypothetical protein KCP70_08340 [Salmonella enterica subsp. enterica]|nr:hypothetical protein KCP70_08340 [Salmonella enterica subsp. enterica]